MLCRLNKAQNVLLVFIIFVVTWKLTNLLSQDNAYFAAINSVFSERGLINLMDFPSFTSLMKQRQETVTRVCRTTKDKLNQNIQSRLIGRFLLLEEEHLIYCPVYKASTSNWMTNLWELSRKDKKEKEALWTKYHDDLMHLGYAVTKKLTTQHAVQTLQESSEHKSFIIVRHPFERLVSAFRNKLESLKANKIQDDFYYKTYGEKIVSTYREKALARFGADFFTEKNFFGAPIYSERRVERCPSFWEYVQFILDTEVVRMDEHWRPIYSYCYVCDIPWHAIVKFENLEQEEAPLKQLLNITQVREKHKNINSKEDLSSEEITQIYFKLLSKAEIMKLYAIYEQDFLLFDYSFSIGDIHLNVNQ